MKLAYYPKESPVHSLDPRSKLLFVLIFVIIVLFETSFTAYGYLFIAVIIPFFFAKVPPKRIYKSFTPFLFLFGITILFHFLLWDGEVIFRLGFIKGTREGFIHGLLFSLRLVLIIFPTILLSFTTSPIDFADSLSGFFKRFKSKTVREIPMIAIFVFRFIPLLVREGRRIIRAQRSRGVKLRINREMFTIIFPIVKNAMKRADQFAMGLHAKGFEPGEERTSLKEFKFTRADYIFIGYSIIPLAIVIIF